MGHRLLAPGPTYVIDFEFATTCGTGRPIPHTFCALNVHTGETICLTGKDLQRTAQCPFDVRKCVTIAYNFTAESECFEVLGWGQPWWPLDLYAEHLVLYNGVQGKRHKLLDACKDFNIPIDHVYEACKKPTQLLCADQVEFTDEQRQKINEYCADDCRVTGELFRAMAENIDLGPAFVRGRWMVCVGQQHFRGIPIDRDAAFCAMAQRPWLRLALVASTPDAEQFYEGSRLVERAFYTYLCGKEIGWPLTVSANGRLRPSQDRDVWSKMVALEPDLKPFKDLRDTLNQLKSFEIQLRSDERIRPRFWPLTTATTRNRASSKELPFLLSKWIRGLVKAPPGRAIAQLDFRAQEVHVIARLSGDPDLIADLEPDPYINAAIRFGFAPPGATDKTHPEVRKLFKVALLAVFYGQKERSLANRLDISPCAARELIAQLHQHYRIAEGWFRSVVLCVLTEGHLDSILATPWSLAPDPKITIATLRNHLVQTTGSDILRASCLHAQDACLSVIATLHDSVLIEADAAEISAATEAMARAMQTGSRDVLEAEVPVKVEFQGTAYPLEGKDLELFERVVGREG